MKPGLYYDISPDAYHRDELTPEPALSSSGIRTLLGATPAHFRAQSPRLTEWPITRESTRGQDLGTVVHKLVLGNGGEFTVIDAADWRTKSAQAQRDDARAQGLVPILVKTFEQASTIASYATNALAEKFGGWPIGQSEVAMLWRDNTANGPIWKRALIDHWSHKAVTEIDLKTTSKAIGDEDLARKIANDGGDIQAAHYIDGIVNLYPDFAGLVQFIFVYVEVEPPYAVRFVKLSESWLTRARFRIERASNLFAECLKTGSWPSWSEEVSLSAPSYLEARWESQELESLA